MKNIIFFILGLIFLNGCFQSTAMVGPTMTFVGTGSIYNAGLSLGANKVVKEETGMETTEYISSLLDDEKRNEKKLNKKLINLVKTNIEKTRKKIRIKKN
tara:strand:+ start:67 stop:366 length:300 start_codon:yes stop_codon:yes gene_type:complete